MTTRRAAAARTRAKAAEEAWERKAWERAAWAQEWAEDAWERAEDAWRMAARARACGCMDGDGLVRRRYTTEAETVAVAERGRLERGMTLRVYECDVVPGGWHLTST